jgi:hypothetical protein
MQESSPINPGSFPGSGSGSRSRPTRSTAAAVLLLLAASALALLLAPRLMPASYNWVAHSTSESAAQGIEGAWLARLGFLLFGVGVLLLTWVAALRRGPWGRVFHGTFGVMMVAAAAFGARPWDDALPFEATEDLLHSVAAFSMGVAFALGVLAVMLRRDVRQIGPRVFDWIAIAAAALIPLAMTVWSDQTGLLQRAMFAIAFVWYGAEALHALRAAAMPDKAPNAAVRAEF